MRRKAILVTASRDWTDAHAIHMTLIGAGAGHLEVLVIHGDCETGGDRMAGDFAKASAGWTPLPMPAPWRRLGRPAGPRRNEAMLKVLKGLRFCGYDCEVHAFPLPQSRGTRHMMTIAEAAGFKVYDHGTAGSP